MLIDRKIIKDVMDVTGSFHDEPPFAYYISLLHPDLEFYNRNGWPFTPTGTSWQSRELALMKCLLETIEKVSLFSFDVKNINFVSYKDKPSNCMNLDVYWDNIPKRKSYGKKMQHINMGWTEGFNLTETYPGYIPAQLIYPNYHRFVFYDRNFEEPLLLPSRQTYHGSAAGTNHTSTLLRAIYELVENDARSLFLTSKRKLRYLDINKMQNKELQRLKFILNNYGFEVYIFNIINDLEIPVIMSILVDLTTVGPLVNTGYRTGLRMGNTIVGSIEDAIYQRYFQRIKMQDNIRYGDLIIKNNLKIFGHDFFSRHVIIQKDIPKIFGSLFNSKLESVNGNIDNDFIKEGQDEQVELSMVISKLKNKGFDIWYKTMKSHILVDDLFIYKVVIPGLQPTLRNVPVSHYYKNRINNATKYYKYSKYYA